MTFDLSEPDAAGALAVDVVAVLRAISADVSWRFRVHAWEGIGDVTPVYSSGIVALEKAAESDPHGIEFSYEALSALAAATEQVITADVVGSSGEREIRIELIDGSVMRVTTHDEATVHALRKAFPAARELP